MMSSFHFTKQNYTYNFLVLQSMTCQVPFLGIINKQGKNFDFAILNMRIKHETRYTLLLHP
jgi:hypothetical protein